MQNYTSRVSVAGLVASTAGSILAASTVLMSAGIALASPGSANRPSSQLPPAPLGGRDLDLPVMRPGLASEEDGFDVPQVDPSGRPGWTLDPSALPPRPPAAPPAPPAPAPRGGDTPTADPTDVPTGPAPTFFGEEIAVENSSIIYVIDNSGSMSVYVDSFVDENGQVVTGTRLDRAKSELRRSITQLPETFTFNVMFFDECVMTCWNGKQAANSENKAAAFTWINNVQPDGWTNTGLGVVTALGDKTNTTIVLLSDGAPNFMDCAMNYVGSYEQHRDLITGQNTQGARIDCFGIGISTDPTARTFMQQVASDSGGTYVDIN